MRLNRSAMPAAMLLGLMVLAGPVRGATIYFVNVVENSSGTGPCTPAGGQDMKQGSSPVIGSLVCGPVGGNINAGAVSSVGQAGAALQLTPGSQTFSIATFTTDVIFSTLNPNASQGPISVALNLAVGGTMVVSAPADASWSATAEIGHTDFSYVTSVDSGGTYCLNGCTRTMGFSSGGEVMSGLSDTVSGILTTPLVGNVALNTPFNISFTLQLQGVGNVNSQFLNGLAFLSGGPVFNLPDGVTANDPDISLVNNVFTDTGTVPEPDSLILIGTGLVAVAGFTRRKSRR